MSNNTEVKPLFTPENITELKLNEIFVFGSNESGIHGAGAARLALYRFGAVSGKGIGLHGQSYAIPTKDKQIFTLSLQSIQKYVTDFIEFAKSHPELTFYTTQIGCGLAGYTPNEIAPLFHEALEVKNIILPESFYNILKK